ncbi:mevalonate kinase [Spirosoma sp. KNUC1025]|uniref:mevalonate kinase family protein n=1 Tax=Spirosoma sp. KNUC1025 TaxID=2894082 RepID=UPI00386597F2|nr:GHMP kinase [Spirosoma sp. KNUC1025]
MSDQLLVSTPGRICLFGEHQDYLGLPVIAAAISKRIQITGHRRTDNRVLIHMPDIGKTESFKLLPELTYDRKRDYFKSAITVLRRDENIRFSYGFEGTIHGNIPINAGASSSSALVITWINFLLQMADIPQSRSQEEIARLAHRAEVLEFGEPGGMMDHYATAVGHVIYLESEPAIRLEPLTPNLGSFVLGDSGQPKDTLGILKRVKYGMLDALDKVRQFDPAFDLHTTPLEEADTYRTQLSPDELSLLKSNLSDRDILREAKTLLTSTLRNDALLGDLLNRHQNNLRDAKRISTPKIDRMLDAAMAAGALGGKINGSGGGGCIFAYAPTNPEVVVEAIERQGAKAYLISMAEGTHVMNLEEVEPS